MRFDFLRNFFRRKRKIEEPPAPPPEEEKKSISVDPPPRRNRPVAGPIKQIKRFNLSDSLKQSKLTPDELIARHTPQ